MASNRQVRASSTGPTSSGAAPDNRCLVQFMWQPLTQMSYAKVTLLTSFEVYMWVCVLLQGDIALLFCTLVYGRPIISVGV